MPSSHGNLDPNWRQCLCAEGFPEACECQRHLTAADELNGHIETLGDHARELAAALESIAHRTYMAQYTEPAGATVKFASEIHAVARRALDAGRECTRRADEMHTMPDPTKVTRNGF